MSGRGAEVLLLSAGGVVGVNARYWLAVWIAGRAVDRFPWATLTINVTGSFAIGLLSVVLGRWLPGHHARLFFLVGLLGGYTTFSSFALEGQILWDRREYARSLAYLGGSVAAGFVAVVLGLALGRALVGPGPVETAVVAAHEISGTEE